MILKALNIEGITLVEIETNNKKLEEKILLGILFIIIEGLLYTLDKNGASRLYIPLILKK